MLKINKLKCLLRLLQFSITQRFAGFPVRDEPYFDEQSTVMFMSLIRDCRLYLEYGSGGSTVVAARLAKPFVSVETDRFYLKSVRKKIGVLSPRQILVHADIGLTGPFGVPLRSNRSTARRLTKWADYPETPWRFVPTHDSPDLILIDGRFRVASALTCCIHLVASPSVRMLVDDYSGRPHYHVIEQYAQLAGMAGRMAVFQPASRSVEELRTVIARYSGDWR